MKKTKITFKVALRLALKETGYKVTLVTALVIMASMLMYARSLHWTPESLWQWGVLVIGMGIFFLLLFARPLNIYEDPTGSGYPEYSKH